MVVVLEGLSKVSRGPEAAGLVLVVHLVAAGSVVEVREEVAVAAVVAGRLAENEVVDGV